jgi:predicted AAA+ superfamily ATPase
MEDASGQLVARRLLSVLMARMADEPVILLEGPRSVGKSTLLRQVAELTGGTIIDADNPAIATALGADPVTMIDVPGPVLIDEYQRAPDVLDAIKSTLNRAPTRPGLFILTGSSRHSALPRAAQSLTGRLHVMQILPLAQEEIDGTPGLLPILFGQGEGAARGVVSRTTRNDYITRVVAGGLPLARARSEVPRRRWFDDYARLTLERDVAELRKVRQARALPRVLQGLAGMTGQVLNVAALAQRLGLDDGSLHGYVRLLEAVFLVRTLPGWGKTLTKRAMAAPKVHVIDSGLAARLLRLSAEKLALREPTALTELGHLMETFVVGEVCKEVSWMDGITEVGHWRTYDGDEVDIVIERDDGAVIGIEVKAGTRASGDSFASLRRLRDLLGASFALGVVLHLGERGFRYDDRLIAMPVDRLWAPAHVSA